MTKLLSLDTSTSITGYCLYKNAEYQKSGILCSKDEKADLKNMCLCLWDLLNEIKPDIIVIETPSVTKNAHTQRALVIVYAAVYIWSILHDNTFFYAMRPTEWRKHCSDDEWRKKIIKKKRPELKKLAVLEVEKLFPNISLYSDDEAEAILIGLAYIHLFS